MTQQTQKICITLVQRRPNVFDVGPTMYKLYTNILRLLGTSFNLYLKVFFYFTDVLVGQGYM